MTVSASAYLVQITGKLETGVLSLLVITYKMLSKRSLSKSLCPVHTVLIKARHGVTFWPQICKTACENSPLFDFFSVVNRLLRLQSEGAINKSILTPQTVIN